LDANNISNGWALVHDEFYGNDPSAAIFCLITGVSVFDLNGVSKERLKIGDVKSPSVFPLAVEGQTIRCDESHDFPSQGIIESASAVV
jgi:hypothetical protein